MSLPAPVLSFVLSFTTKGRTRGAKLFHCGHNLSTISHSLHCAITQGSGWKWFHSYVYLLKFFILANMQGSYQSLSSLSQCVPSFNECLNMQVILQLDVRQSNIHVISMYYIYLM